MHAQPSRRPNSVSLPPDARRFQQVDAALKNRCRLVFKNEESPAWSRAVPTGAVARLGEELDAVRGAVGHDVPHASQISVNEFLAQAFAIIGAEPEPQRALQDLDEREDEGLRGWITHVAELTAFLVDAGIQVDKYGFAWIVKQDHYFRVSLLDTQAYLFLLDEPGISCRVCIVARGRGKDIDKRTGFNQRDMLAISKIFAIEFDLLPGNLAGQVRAFVATRGDRTGAVNLFPFDAISVFGDEIKERSPEVYAEMVRAWEKHPNPMYLRTCLISEIEAAVAHRGRVIDDGPPGDPPTPPGAPRPTVSLVAQLEEALARRRRMLDRG